MAKNNNSSFGGLSKAKYFAKHASQKIIGLIPYGFKIQEAIKERRGHWASRTPDGAYSERLKTQAQRLKVRGIVPNVVVEQGTGWSGVDLVIFHLLGAKEIRTYDIHPWLRASLLQQAACEVLDNLEVFDGWAASGLQDRADRLRDVLDRPLDELLTHMNVHYRVTTDFTYPEVADDSVDLFFSYSTLQRLRPDALRDIAKHSRRVLKTGGVNCHRVHMQDFHRITDRRVPPFYYLTINNWLWGLMTSTYLNYQNRWRLPQFLGLFDEFEIETDNVLRREDDINDLQRRFPNFTPQDIVTWQADIFARKH